MGDQSWLEAERAWYDLSLAAERLMARLVGWSVLADQRSPVVVKTE